MSATIRPMRPNLALQSERFGRVRELLVTFLVGAGIVYLALEGGGYGTTQRSAFGVVIWLLVLVMLTFARAEDKPIPAAAFVVGGAIALFATITGLSTFWSESAGRSFLELARVLVYLGIFVAIVLAVRISSRRAVVNGLVAGVGLVTLLAVLSRLVPALFPAQEYQKLDPESAARLTFPVNYWNGLAAFLAMGVALLLFQATREDVSPRWRALGTALVPVAGLGLYLTFSRGGVATTVLACAVTLALSPRRTWALWTLAIGGVGSAVLIELVSSYRSLNDGLITTHAARSEGLKVVVALVVVMGLAYLAALARPAVERRIPERIRSFRIPRRGPVAIGIGLSALAIAVALGAGEVSSRWERFKDPIVFQGNVSESNIESRFLSSSGNGRYQYWTASRNAFDASPIGGRGAGTWDFWWRRHATTGGTVRDSHSIVGDVIAELGTLGALALLAMFGSILYVAFAAWRRAGPGQRTMEAALAAVSASFVFHAIFDWIWELAAIGAVMFVAIGVQTWGDGLRRVLPSRALMAGLGVAAVAWLAIFAEAIPLLSTWKINQSESAARAGDLDRALRAAQGAHTIEPWSGDPLLQIAQVRELIAPNQEALDAADRAVRNEPTNWETWFVLARIEAKAGQRAAAEQHLKIARSLNPLSPIWDSLGGVDGLARS